MTMVQSNTGSGKYVEIQLCADKNGVPDLAVIHASFLPLGPGATAYTPIKPLQPIGSGLYWLVAIERKLP